MDATKLAFRIPELAARASVSPSQLRREIRAGRGPRITRIGEVPVIRVQDAEDWLARLAAAAQVGDEPPA